MDAELSHARNYHQYLLMKEILCQFTQNKIGLASLVGDLKALFYSLENPDKAWEEEFFNDWGTIETVYALALYQIESGNTSNVEAITSDQIYRAQINDAVNNLKSSISEKLMSVEKNAKSD